MFPQNSDKQAVNFTLYPLLWLAICFALGIILSNFLPITWKVYLFFCAFFSLLAAIFVKKQIALILIFAAIFASGGICFEIQKISVAENRLKILYDSNQINSGDPIEIEGTLDSEPETAIGGFFIEIETEKAIYKEQSFEVSGKIRLFAPISDEEIQSEYEQLNLNYGSKITVACNLKREDKFLNPGVVSQKKILDQKDIDANGTIKSPLLIEKISDSNNFFGFVRLYEMRREIAEDFRKTFNQSTAGVLIASLLGNRYFLDKQTAEVFREGGTFHVLVISGLHITFIGGLILLFVRFFTKQRFWQFLTASLVLWSYAVAVGAGLPVIRASIMFTILLFSQVIYRKGSLLNAFGACVLIMLVWRPEDIFNQSFQLTVTSVTSILAMAFPLIENFRRIGSWSPSAETPFPPNVSKYLRSFCETLYWREKIWERDLKRQIWSANLFKSPYLEWFAKRDLQKLLSFTFEAFVVSFVVQIWLLPLMIVYFHRLPLFGVFLNIWVGIIVALQSFAAFVALLFAQLGKFFAFPFIKITEFFNWILISIPQFLIENNLASVRLPVYSENLKAVYFLYFAPLLLLTILLNLWNPFALSSNFRVWSSKLKFALISASFILFSIIVFHPFSAPFADGRLHVDFLDVGQGDSALITFPNGETLLIDGGGQMNFNENYTQNDAQNEPEPFEMDGQNIGESVVSEFLWERGYSKIDYILATHADADHIQGLSDVAKNFQIKAALFGRMPFQDADFAELYKILQRRKIPFVKLSRGEVLTFGGATVEILYPLPNDTEKVVSENNKTLVVRVIYGNKKFLFTGDIEKEAENYLVQNPALLQANVVKVAHHGSRTSSTQNFINAAKAEYAIIPVGKTSRFGHPHEEVVERWKNAGAKIMTTGERGTISISTNGKDLHIETFIK